MFYYLQAVFKTLLHLAGSRCAQDAVPSTNPLFLATSNPGNRGDCKKTGGKSSRATQNVSTSSAVHLARRLNYVIQ